MIIVRPCGLRDRNDLSSPVRSVGLIFSLTLSSGLLEPEYSFDIAQRHGESMCHHFPSFRMQQYIIWKCLGHAALTVCYLHQVISSSSPSAVSTLLSFLWSTHPINFCFIPYDWNRFRPTMCYLFFLKWDKNQKCKIFFFHNQSLLEHMMAKGSCISRRTTVTLGEKISTKSKQKVLMVGYLSRAVIVQYRKCKS